MISESKRDSITLITGEPRSRKNNSSAKGESVLEERRAGAWRHKNKRCLLKA